MRWSLHMLMIFSWNWTHVSCDRSYSHPRLLIWQGAWPFDVSELPQKTWHSLQVNTVPSKLKTLPNLLITAKVALSCFIYPSDSCLHLFSDFPAGSPRRQRLTCGDGGLKFDILIATNKQTNIDSYTCRWTEILNCLCRGALSLMKLRAETQSLKRYDVRGVFLASLRQSQQMAQEGNRKCPLDFSILVTPR